MHGVAVLPAEDQVPVVAVPAGRASLERLPVPVRAERLDELVRQVEGSAAAVFTSSRWYALL